VVKTSLRITSPAASFPEKSSGSRIFHAETIVGKKVVPIKDSKTAAAMLLTRAEDVLCLCVKTSDL
jgi:hypothetical protein